MLRVQDFCKPYSTPNQKKAYNELSKRLIKYVGMVRAIYDALNLEASKLAIRTGYDSSMDVPFRFSDYPQIQKAIQELQASFVTQLGTMITSAMSEEWKRSNTFADMLADKVLKSYGAHKRDKYYRVNNEALQAFQRRRDSGMNLSQKLWNQSEDYKRGLEHTLSVAIEKGMSAVALSKRVSKYLLDFDSLRKDYGSRFGRATDIHDCEYRSVRLARSEINMAYRNAEQLRWSQMDFIIGYEVKLSSNHNCKGVPQGTFYDICDELKGRYPKDFKWLGWHPNCRCYVVPIIKSEERFWEDEDKRGNDNEEITELPDNFKQWAAQNKDRIDKAESRGTSPYFVRDNRERVKQAVVSGELAPSGIGHKTDQLRAINIPLTVFNNKNEFRALQQEVRQELKNVGNVQIVNKNLYTSRLFFGKNERRSVVAHCFDADEITVVRNLPHLFNTLKDGRYEPINMARSNYREKMKSGIRNYVVYNIEINGIIYELKCTVKAQKSIKHGSMIEYPYSLKKMRNNKVA